MIISGYASIKDVADGQGDIFKGNHCYDYQMYMQLPVVVESHENSIVNAVGRCLDMSEDSAGLKMTAITMPYQDNLSPALINTLVGIDAGIISGLSIRSRNYRYKTDRKLIIKAIVKDVSVCALPENPLCSFAVQFKGSQEKCNEYMLEKKLTSAYMDALIATKRT